MGREEQAFGRICSFFHVLETCDEGMWEGFFQDPTSPKLLACCLTTDIPDRGIGPVGDIAIPADTWDRLAPLQLTSVGHMLFPGIHHTDEEACCPIRKARGTSPVPWGNIRSPLLGGLGVVARIGLAVPLEDVHRGHFFDICGHSPDVRGHFPHVCGPFRGLDGIWASCALIHGSLVSF